MDYTHEAEEKSGTLIWIQWTASLSLGMKTCPVVLEISSVEIRIYL